MTGRRRMRDNVGMNLFPFLAVLICTMGSLIMLLVVMVQQARVRAEETMAPTLASAQALAEMEETQAARQALYDQRKAAAEQAQQEVDGLKWQVSVLQESYEKTVRDVSEQRLALSHLESHARELSEQAAMMQTEANLIASAAIEAKATDDEGHRLHELETKIATAMEELKDAREDLAAQTPKYALIPYDGPSGTSRPPIYIECLPERVVLQPENVVLIGEDFREPLTTDNPLALALRTKREFMQKNGLLSEGLEPYPLLVVRPGSAASYAAVRSAMKSWEAEFGYELVEADIELDYLDPDPRLSQLLSDVIEESRSRRRLFRSVRARPRRQPELLRPSSSGGFETVSSGSSSIVGRRSAGGGSYDNPSANDPFGSGSTAYGASGYGNTGHESTGSPSRNEHPTAARFGDGERPTGRYGQELAGEGTPAPSSQTGPAGPAAGDSNDRVAGAELGDAGPETASGRQIGSASAGATVADSAGGPSSPAAPSSFGGMPSLSETRGKDWALPRTQADSVGIRRPINVVCDRERLLLLPEKGTPQELRIFRHGGTLSGVIDPFVEAVRSRLTNWGIAGHGIHWRPILQVQVNEGATSDYNQLLHLLENSGIEVTRKP